VDASKTFPSFRVFPKENFCVNVCRAHSSNRMFFEGYYSERTRLYCIKPGCFSNNQPADPERLPCSKSSEFFSKFLITGRNSFENGGNTLDDEKCQNCLNVCLLKIVDAPIVAKIMCGPSAVTAALLSESERAAAAAAGAAAASGAGASGGASGGAASAIHSRSPSLMSLVSQDESDSADRPVAKFPLLKINGYSVYVCPPSEEQLMAESITGGRCHKCLTNIVRPHNVTEEAFLYHGRRICKCVGGPLRVPNLFQCYVCKTQIERRQKTKCLCDGGNPTYKWSK